MQFEEVNHFVIGLHVEVVKSDNAYLDTKV